MALLVENGTTVVGAESYVSVADCIAYADNRGLTFSASTTALQEQALRRATVWLDGKYRSRYVGLRKDGLTQALEWPRVAAIEQVHPFKLIANNTIPGNLIDATCEAAVRELATPGGLSPDVTPGKIQKSVTVVGAVSVDYAASNGAQDQKPIVSIITGILDHILDPVQMFSGYASRG